MSKKIKYLNKINFPSDLRKLKKSEFKTTIILVLLAPALFIAS